MTRGRSRGGGLPSHLSGGSARRLVVTMAAACLLTMGSFGIPYVSGTVSADTPSEATGREGSGSQLRTLATRGGIIEYVNVLEMEASAYYPGPESTGKWWGDGLTAMGLTAGHGVVAVDPEVIPLGTWLFIPGYGIAIAGDVGSAIKGQKVDLCFDSHLEAILFGRRSVKVYVLAPSWVEARGPSEFPTEWLHASR